MSLMSRLVVTYPNWACQVIGSQPAIDINTKQRFQDLVVQNRMPVHPRDGRLSAKPNDQFRRTPTVELSIDVVWTGLAARV